MKKILLILMLAPFLLVGCVTIGEYQAEGIVEVPESPGISVAATPWTIAEKLFSLLGEVIPTVGQTRRKAMEERVNYKETRRFTIFRAWKGQAEKPDE